MTEILAAVIGVILGVLLDKIIFWKIKQKIENLDMLLRDVLDYNSKFLEFIRLSLNSTSVEEDYIVFGKQSSRYINSGYMGSYIIYGSPDKCKESALYKSLYEYYNFVAKILNAKDVNNLRDNFFLVEGNELTPMAKDYEAKMHLCINNILLYRNQLTSLNPIFWFKKLFIKVKILVMNLITKFK